MHKLGERLFSIYVGGDGFGKKKGMHWSTFNRLHDRYKTLEQMWYVSVEVVRDLLISTGNRLSYSDRIKI